MKKLVLLLAFLPFVFLAQAQNVKTFWGTAADTLTASVAKTQVIPISSNEYKDFAISVFTDSVSGTPAYTAKLEYSLDGTNYFAILSAPDDTHTGGLDNSLAWKSIYYKTFSVTGDTTTVMVHTPVLAKYLKITVTATSAAQKSLCYGYYIIVPYKD